MFLPLLFTCKVAYANVPIGAAFVMSFPVLSMFVTWGLALLAVILIEGFILKKKLDLNYVEAFNASFQANVFSTLIGIGIAVAYTSSVAFLVCWIPGAIVLQRYFKMLAEKTGCCVNFEKRKVVSFMASLGIGLMGLFLGSLLSPWSHFGSALYKGKAIPPNYFLIIPVSLALLILGFMITLIVEGAIVARLFPQKQKKVVPVVVVMNLFSYIFLLLVTGLKVLRILFRG